MSSHTPYMKTEDCSILTDTDFLPGTNRQYLIVSKEREKSQGEDEALGLHYAQGQSNHTPH